MDEQGFVTIGKYKVKVDRDLCIGAASCVAIADKTYSLDGENKAVLHSDSTNTPEDILMAAQSCPTKAVIIKDAETDVQIWPTS